MCTEATVNAVVVIYHERRAVGLVEQLAKEPAVADVHAVVNGADPDLLVSLSTLAATQGSIHVYVTPRNVGFGRAVNLGFTAASSLGPRPLLLTVSHEISFGPGDLTRMATTLLQAPEEVAAVGPVLRTRNGIFSRGGHFDRDRLEARHLQAPGRIDWLDGGCVLLRTDAFADVGGYDDAFFLYYEDVDLGLRLTAANRKLEVLDNVVVEQATAGIRFDRYAVGLALLARKHGLPRRRVLARIAISGMRYVRKNTSVRDVVLACARATVVLFGPQS